jgi:hypothetical protein
MKTLTTLAAFIVLPLALATAADEPTPPATTKVDPAQVFKKFDRDSDGGISLEEYKAGMAGHMDPNRIESVFKKKDADGDGKLSLSEMMYVPPEPATPAPTAKPASAEKKKNKPATK